VQCFPILIWFVPKKFLKGVGKAKRLYEAYFNNKSNETITLGKISEEVEIPNMAFTNYIDMENMIIEYNLNDVFGTLPRLPLYP
jgi:hypothetical protein